MIMVLTTWQRVAPELIEVGQVADIPEEEFGRKAVEVSVAEGVPKKPMMLMRYGNRIMASDPVCTRCKFPLLRAPVSKEEISCQTCGAVYSLPTGEVAPEQKGTFLSVLFSRTPLTRLGVYATLVKNGKVFIGLAPQKAEE
mmetsp:Transcript_2286/g.6928  ORF Transcript_2286/g.6928 Transcript_2286/m.6928 type:complete len:141 (-) Transcript_2286:149-571(-)